MNNVPNGTLFFEYEYDLRRIGGQMRPTKRKYALSLSGLLEHAPECNSIRRVVDGKLIPVVGEERKALLAQPEISLI
jgi:hypothetical protein